MTKQTRKVNNAKKETTQAAAKAPTKRKPRSKAQTQAAAKTAQAFTYWPEGGSAYEGFYSATSKEGKLILPAAFVVAGFAKMGAKGLLSATGTGNKALLQAIVDRTPYAAHKRAKRFTASDTLTKAALDHFNGRIRTDKDLASVKALVEAMTKGGKVEGFGLLDFSRKVEIEIKA